MQRVTKTSLGGHANQATQFFGLVATHFAVHNHDEMMHACMMNVLL